MWMPQKSTQKGSDSLQGAFDKNRHRLKHQKDGNPLQVRYTKGDHCLKIRRIQLDFTLPALLKGNDDRSPEQTSSCH